MVHVHTCNHPVLPRPACCPALGQRHAGKAVTSSEAQGLDRQRGSGTCLLAQKHVIKWIWLSRTRPGPSKIIKIMRGLLPCPGGCRPQCTAARAGITASSSALGPGRETFCKRKARLTRFALLTGTCHAQINTARRRRQHSGC